MELIIRLAQLWQQPWTHWVVFAAAWLLAYLPVSAILYSQYAMWTRDQANRMPVYAIAIVSALAGACVGIMAIICVDAVYRWYKTPWGPPLPTLLDPGYTRFWLPLIIASGIALVAICGIWYELHKMRRLKEQDNLFFTKLNQSPDTRLKICSMKG